MFDHSWYTMFFYVSNCYDGQWQWRHIKKNKQNEALYLSVSKCVLGCNGCSELEGEVIPHSHRELERLGDSINAMLSLGMVDETGCLVMDRTLSTYSTISPTFRRSRTILACFIRTIGGILWMFWYITHLLLLSTHPLNTLYFPFHMVVSKKIL